MPAHTLSPAPSFVPALPHPRCARRARRAAGWSMRGLGLGVTLMLMACATGQPYQPYDGAGAARLRVRLSFPAEDRALTSPYRLSATVQNRRLEGESCGEPTGHPTLRPWRATAAPTGPGSTAAPPPLLYPRAAMAGATPAEDSESIELSLAPGTHIVSLRIARDLGNLSTTHCDAALVLRLEPGRQHELLAGFTERGQCRWESLRLEGERFVPAPVQRQGRLHQICDGRRYRPA